MHGTKYSTYFINKSVRKLLLRSAQMQSVTTRWRCSKSEPLLSVTAFFKIIIYSESTNTFYIEVFNVSNRKIKSKDFCYDPLETVLCTNRKTHFNSETDHKCFKWHVNDFFVECRPKRQRQCLCCLSKFITANWYLCWLKKAMHLAGWSLSPCRLDCGLKCICHLAELCSRAACWVEQASFLRTKTLGF